MVNVKWAFRSNANGYWYRKLVRHETRIIIIIIIIIIIRSGDWNRKKKNKRNLMNKFMCIYA